MMNEAIEKELDRATALLERASKLISPGSSQPNPNVLVDIARASIQLAEVRSKLGT